MGRKRKMVFQDGAANEDKATNASSSDLEKLEKLHSDIDNSQAIEARIVQNQISNGVKPETNSRLGSVVARRSTRLNSLASPTRSLQDMDQLVAHVNLVEDEKEQETEGEHVSIPPEMNGKSLEERVDCLVRAAADEYFKSKVCKGEDVVPCPDISYKSLYFNAQKKIEALIEEHYELVRMLEFANGKIAAYEGMKENSVLVSGLGKGADVAVNLSPKPAEKSTIPTPAPAPAPSPEGANQPRTKRTYKKRVMWGK